ncbi:MAG: alpha/beta hydrolase [Candidatus Daviesbacteria bacterium]|nr:alpha/beta hydrolase [Candidatus Daviesbacteria bacterium]
METNAEVISPTEAIKPTLSSQDIVVGTDVVRVSCAEFFPHLTEQEQEHFDPTRAVIHLPGWPWKVDQSVIWPLPRSLAEQSKVRTLSIDTRTNKIGPDSLQIESAGIAAFLEEQSVREVTLVGHSEGAIRAVNLAVVLQEQYPDIKINGVVLANPMGMNNRSLAEIAKGFLLDIFKISGQERRKMGVDKPKGLEMQFAQSLLKDIAFAGPRYLHMLKNQLNNLININPYLEKIKAPVVVMATDRDLVSDLRKYLPPSEIENRQPPPQTEEELIDEIGKKWDEMSEERKTEYEAIYGSRENYINSYQDAYKSRKEMVSLTRVRQRYLEANLLPEAENVVFLVGTKHADHGGIIDFRPETAAHIISRIFGRLRRQ